jgi:ubiquinone/menaquinone biosynthesis C-methylase UbiE
VEEQRYPGFAFVLHLGSIGAIAGGIESQEPAPLEGGFELRQGAAILLPMSLPRVPSQGGPEGPEEVRAYDALDRSASDRDFVAFLEDQGCARGELLDIGTGPGDIPLLLVERDPELEVTGIDPSLDMLRIARLKTAERGHSRRIRLLEVDATELPFERECFDGAFAKHVLHHVSDPVAMLREALRVLRPGAPLVVRDLVRPGSEEELQRLLQANVGEQGEMQQRMFERTTRAAYTMDEYAAILAQVGFESAELQRTSERHVSFCIRKP